MKQLPADIPLRVSEQDRTERGSAGAGPVGGFADTGVHRLVQQSGVGVAPVPEKMGETAINDGLMIFSGVAGV